MKIDMRFSSGKYNESQKDLLKRREVSFFPFSFLTNIYTEVHCSGGNVLMASCVYISINNTDNCKNKKGKRRILSTLRKYITEFSGR